MGIAKLEGRHRADVLGMLERTIEFRPEEVVVAAEVLDASLSGDGSYRARVAEDERGAAIGWACFGRTPLTAWTFDLYWLVVDPSARRAKLGRALVDEVVRSVRAEGGRVMRVETSSKHGGDVTHAFYTHLGFAQSGRVAEFYGPGDDLVIYALAL